MSSAAYLAGHGVEAALLASVKRVLKERPSDPVHAIGRYLLQQDAKAFSSSAMPKPPPPPLASVDEEYGAAVRYIFSNADFSGSAKRYQNPQENWRRFDQLLEQLGNPQQQLKVIHIAGTNGKGTTSALCEAMLRAGGTKGPVGLFTSPHMHSFRERIRVGGRLVTKDAIVEATSIVKPAVEQLGYASPFEKLTALALVCFARAGAEWAVLETGLGGRWDCTNHCDPLVCGITRIGLDHMNVLGNTVAKIAGEKAGILKASAPAFTVPQLPEALEVLERTAVDVGTSLTACHADGADASSLPAWLSPQHQQHNAQMAMAMIESLASRGHVGTDASAWTRARDTAFWPARFEVFCPAPLKEGALLVLDVAHNEPAVEALVRSISAAYPGEALVVVFGANCDKDVHKIVSLLSAAPGLCRAVAVQSSHPKAVPPAQIIQESQAVENVVQWDAAPSMDEALVRAASALEEYASGSGVVLCCGSVFVAADMRSALAKSQPGLFQEGDWAFEEAAEPPLLM